MASKHVAQGVMSPKRCEVLPEALLPNQARPNKRLQADRPLGDGDRCDFGECFPGLARGSRRAAAEAQSVGPLGAVPVPLDFFDELEYSRLLIIPIVFPYLLMTSKQSSVEENQRQKRIGCVLLLCLLLTIFPLALGTTLPFSPSHLWGGVVGILFGCIACVYWNDVLRSSEKTGCITGMAHLTTLLICGIGIVLFIPASILFATSISTVTQIKPQPFLLTLHSCTLIIPALYGATRIFKPDKEK